MRWVLGGDGGNHEKQCSKRRLAPRVEARENGAAHRRKAVGTVGAHRGTGA
jgi:hypothetical protein